MNVEQIMKPYFERKEKNEKKYIQDKNALKLRLDRLRENKEVEINEYINNALNSNQNFYVGYGAMLKKDLEQAYAEKEAQLEKEINNFDKFYRVDVRELSDIKQALRKDLFSAKKNLEFRLQEAELNYNIVMSNLSKFKLQYDEQHNVVNGDAYKEIYAQADSLIDVKRNIQKELESVNKYIAETELTKEEISVLMMSMTPWEREEYDRRKSLNNNKEEIPVFSLVDTLKQYPNGAPSDEEINQLINEIKDKENTVTENSDKEEIVVEDMKEEIIPTVEDETIIEIPTEEEIIPTVEDETIIEIPTEESTTTSKKLEENLNDFLSEIFKDILENSKKMGVISAETIEKKDDEIELENGFYCNSDDLIKATKNYYKKNKGQKFKVKGIEENLSVTRKGLKRLKDAMKKCSTLILLKDKKLGSTDIKRVYGKAKADEYDAELQEFGTIQTEHKEGYYVNADEYAKNLKHLFGEKRDSWLKRLTSKLRKSRFHEEDIENMDQLDENVKIR